jgi:hypothetical protein
MGGGSSTLMVMLASVTILTMLSCATTDGTVRAPSADERRHATFEADLFHGITPDWTNERHVETAVRLAELLREDCRHHSSLGEEDAAQTALRQLVSMCQTLPATLELPWALRREDVCADHSMVSCE